MSFYIDLKNLDRDAWPIAIEGAVDYAAGRPLDANPYGRENAADAYEAWAAGWRDAHDLFPRWRLARERARWHHGS